MIIKSTRGQDVVPVDRRIERGPKGSVEELLLCWEGSRDGSGWMKSYEQDKSLKQKNDCNS